MRARNDEERKLGFCILSEDGFTEEPAGVVRVEMDRTGLAYVRFRVRDIPDEEAYKLARKLCKKLGFKYDNLNANVGPSWKLAKLTRDLREAGIRPILGASVIYEMNRLAAAYNATDAHEKADARADAIEATSGKKFRDYQREDLRWIEAAGSCILAYEMRVGKTVLGMGLYPANAGAIVVCPVGIKSVWEAHFRDWLPWVTVKTDGDPYSVKPGEAVIVNYEKVPPDKERCTPRGCLLIADEAQALKNPNAQRTRNFEALAKTVRANEGRVVLATGTPAKNGRPAEIWTLLEILGVGKSLFGNSRTFNQEWREYHRPDQPIVGPLSRVMTRRTYAEVVGRLPEWSWAQRKITVADLENPDDCQDLCRNLDYLWGTVQNQDDPLAGLRGEGIGAYSKLRARISGLKSDAAIAWALEMVESEIPCVVASMYVEPVQRVAEALQDLGHPCGLITGQISEADRREAVRAFQAGESNCIAMTALTGGVGLDLSRAEAILQVDLSFVPGDNDQTIARLLSVANPKPKIGCRLVFDHPLEERVDEILIRKSEIIGGTVGKIGTNASTIGGDIAGDLMSGDVHNGVPEGVNLNELHDIMKGLI